MNILQVNNLVKHYGHIKALKGVSFSVPQGSVFGILGPNGSGKTTLLGTVLNVINATSGDYTWGSNSKPEDARKQIGTLLETPNFYPYLNAVQNLTICSHIKGRGQSDIDRVLQAVNLHQRKTSLFSTYSLGMKQRLAIGNCILGNPDILVLDEPTNGLDPAGIAEIRALIKQLASEGKTIIMASHLLDEVEKVCTHVAILKQGNLLTSGSVGEIFGGGDLVFVSADDNAKLQNLLQQSNLVQNATAETGGLLLNLQPGVSLGQVNSYCFGQGMVLNTLAPRKKSLEAQFLEITQ
jgi:ABC-type multidrug transport system ATPase subunit